MVFATKAMILKTFFFSKIQVYYFDTLYGSIGWKKILLQTIGWEKKISFTQNSFGSTWINVECREIGVKVENW